MNKATFDFSIITDINQFYLEAKTKLPLPAYFGNNLDALWDCLTGDIKLPVEIYFKNISTKQKVQFSKLIHVMQEAEDELNHELKFKMNLTPKEVVEKFVEYFNLADSDKLAELYHEDAINFQVANEHPVEGKKAIHQFFVDGFAQADMVCIVENIFEDGEWGMLEWKDPLGLRGCGFFHVIDDKIKFQRGYWDKLSFLKKHNISIDNS